MLPSNLNIEVRVVTYLAFETKITSEILNQLAMSFIIYSNPIISEVLKLYTNKCRWFSFVFSNSSAKKKIKFPVDQFLN